MLSLSVAVLFTSSIAAVAISRRNGTSLGVLIAAAVMMTVGAGIGIVPGLIAMLGAVVTAATGPASDTPWGALGALVVGGMLVGIGAGAAMASFAADFEPWHAIRRAVGAVFGAAVGCGCSWLSMTVAQPWWLVAGMIVAPSVLGFAIPHRPRAG